LAEPKGGQSPQRVAIIRQAFERVVKDPDCLDDAARARRCSTGWRGLSAGLRMNAGRAGNRCGQAAILRRQLSVQGFQLFVRGLLGQGLELLGSLQIFGLILIMHQKRLLLIPGAMNIGPRSNSLSSSKTNPSP
jgi:hypothetical protein